MNTSITSTLALNYDQKTVFLATSLMMLQILDAILTASGLQLIGGNTVGEGNIILRILMENLGVIPALVLAKLGAIIAIIGMVICSKKVIWIPTAFKMLTFVYIFAAIIPWTMILLHQ
jgi:hypothetical protein